MNSETILFLSELGVEVPEDVMVAVTKGEWA
jgi:hypothetical protein